MTESDFNPFDMTLTVSIVAPYGRGVTIRPECPVSRLFTELLGQKTLTEENIRVIKELGFTVKTKEVRL